MNGGKKIWVGMGLSVIFVALFFLTLDFERLLEALASANYIYVIPGIGLYLIGVWFRTLRWRWLLKHMKPVKTQRLFPVVVVGYMANNLLPMRLGELVRSYYVSAREGVNKPAALITIFIERLLDALTLLLFIAAIALFVPLAGLAEGFGERSNIPWPFLAAAISLPFVGAFGGLVFLSFAPRHARQVAVLCLRPVPAKLSERLLDIVDKFLQGIEPLRSPGSLFVLFMLSLPVWLFEAGLFYLVGYSFGLQHVYGSAFEMAVAMILVTALANIGSSIPAAPGGIGLFELIARETLVLLPLAAVDRSVAGGYVAVVHACLLLPMIVMGQFFLWSEHISLKSLSRAGRRSDHGVVPASATSSNGDDIP